MSGRSERLTIETARGAVRGVFNPGADAAGGVIMVGGAGGGIHGPGGVYEPLAGRLQVAGVASLRLDYRAPNDRDECVHDVLAGVAALGERGVGRVALIGWSFGGAVVIEAGARSGAVAGVATVASQTYGADAVTDLAPKPLLLIHGTGDRVLPDSCSRDLYARAGQPKELVLYPGDDHGITHHAGQLLDTLDDWCRRVASGE